MSGELQVARSLIRALPDHPVPGVVFRDIMPLLAHGPSLRAAVEAMVAPFEGQFDLIAGAEARGFLLAGYAASVTGTGLLPVRKSGRLPQPAASADYALEYGTASVEVQADAPVGSRVLLMDDVLATGGTLAAAADVLRQVGVEPIGVSLLLELPALGGRERLEGLDVHSVFSFD